MSLCTLAQVKTFLGIGAADTQYDAVFAQIIAGVSTRLARRAGRIYAGAPCLEKTSLVQYISVPEDRTQVIWLAAWPVVSVSEIKEALYGDWTDADALVENESYQLRQDIGGLYRIGWWLKGTKTVRATYIGGYAAAGATPGTGETALPDDIVEKAIQQTAFWFSRRKQLGISSAGTQGGSFTTYARDKLLDDVEEVMDGYCRKI